LTRLSATPALAIVAISSLLASAQEPSDPVKTRSFTLDYQVSVQGVHAGSQVRLWLPIPPSNEQQVVTIARQALPSDGTFGTETKYGNQMVYCETRAAADRDIMAAISYDVKRREVRRRLKDSGIKLTEKQQALFLSANALVPINSPQPSQLIEDIDQSSDQLQLARQLYDRVDDHMKYDKSRPGYGKGDVLWACDSQFGNCTDFHSLFISFARTRGLPARFEIGFPLPPERGSGKIGGYHCWAYFFVNGNGWFPVDISEADKHPELKEYYFGNLTENRVTFSTGRDIVLTPPQNGPALNYFVYPYVEVDGNKWPADKLDLSFTFKDK
jgi:transglutaminase-like putative cysteine protease